MLASLSLINNCNNQVLHPSSLLLLILLSLCINLVTIKLIFKKIQSSRCISAKKLLKEKMLL